MCILHRWTCSVRPTVFRRAVHVITGEFLVPGKFSSSVLVALVAISRENMTNLHGDAVRKAHRGLGPLNLQAEISQQGQPSLKRLVHIRFGVSNALYQIWSVLHQEMSVQLNHGGDVQRRWGRVNLLGGWGGGAWPRHMCHPHQPSAVCSSRSHTPSFCGMWATHSGMGFEGNGLESFPLCSKVQLERFNWLFIPSVLARFSLLYCRSLQKHKYRRVDIYFPVIFTLTLG